MKHLTQIYMYRRKKKRMIVKHHESWKKGRLFLVILATNSPEKVLNKSTPYFFIELFYSFNRTLNLSNHQFYHQLSVL